MKILMAMMGLDIGGAETHVAELARELTRQMEVSPDPVYGNGFRMVKAVYEHNRGDLKATITELRKMNQ